VRSYLIEVAHRRYRMGAFRLMRWGRGETARQGPYFESRLETQKKGAERQYFGNTVQSIDSGSRVFT
jgi:hypothetical protein